MTVCISLAPIRMDCPEVVGGEINLQDTILKLQAVIWHLIHRLIHTVLITVMVCVQK